MQRIKLDPIAYVLLVGLLVMEIYANFIRSRGADEALELNNAAYQESVFDSEDTKGVMHQVFRQNEMNRELLKAVFRGCAR